MKGKRKILKLTLKKEWFDMILSGEKKEEYREVKEYWMHRLEDSSTAMFVINYKKFDLVEFKNGYGENVPTMLVECLEINHGYSNPKWCGGIEDFFYVIKLGKIVETKNLKQDEKPS